MFSKVTSPHFCSYYRAKKSPGWHCSAAEGKAFSLQPFVFPWRRKVTFKIKIFCLVVIKVFLGVFCVQRPAVLLVSSPWSLWSMHDLKNFHFFCVLLIFSKFSCFSSNSRWIFFDQSGDPITDPKTRCPYLIHNYTSVKIQLLSFQLALAVLYVFAGPCIGYICCKFRIVITAFMSFACYFDITSVSFERCMTGACANHRWI